MQLCWWVAHCILGVCFRPWRTPLCKSSSAYWLHLDLHHRFRWQRYTWTWVGGIEAEKGDRILEATLLPIPCPFSSLNLLSSPLHLSPVFPLPWSPPSNFFPFPVLILQHQVGILWPMFADPAACHLQQQKDWMPHHVLQQPLRALHHQNILSDSLRP